MKIAEKLFGKLKEFGLNTYESKIWIALLSRGVSTAGELSEISNVPRSRAYDVLETLEKKGFIMMNIGKPIKYMAVKPEEVISRVKKKILLGAERQVEILEELKDDKLMGELDLLYTKGVEILEPSDMSGAMKDRDNYYNNMITMINNAQKSIEIITTEDGLVRKAAVFKKVLEKAKRRGISIRIAAPITKKSQKAADELSRFAELKNVSIIKARFAVFDSKQVAFNLLDDAKAVPDYDIGVWVNTEFFANALRTLFDQVWNEKIVVKVRE